MIEFAHDLLVELVLTPQADEDRGEFRAYLDVDELPIDVAPQALTVLDVTTDPIGYEIGAMMEVRHRIDVGVAVQHGELGEATRIRNRILLELCARLDAVAPAMMAADDPDGGRQQITRARWSIDYRPLNAADDLIATAVIEFAIDADVRTPVVV